MVRTSRGWFDAISPMPDKPTLSKFGPISAWGTGFVKPGARIIGGVWCEGRRYLLDQDRTILWNITQSTDVTASVVEHPE